MNPHDEQLNRLFRAAAQVTPALISQPPFGFETRLLAAWREGRLAKSSFWDMTLLTRGLLVAGLIMVVSFWPALKSSESMSNPFADFLQLADSTVPSSDAP